MVTRRKLLAALVVVSGLASVKGATGQAEDAAVERVKAFYADLQSATKDAAVDPMQRLAAISEAMMRTFEIGAMTRLAIGPQWSKIPAAKQASLQDAFGRYFVATYGSQLGKATGGRFEVTPKSEERAGGRLVRTRVIDAEGKVTPVDYLVGADGRVADIYLAGTVSMIAGRRSEFAGALKQGGPDALEANLRKRADELMGGK